MPPTDRKTKTKRLAAWSAIGTALLGLGAAGAKTVTPGVPEERVHAIVDRTADQIRSEREKELAHFATSAQLEQLRGEQQTNFAEIKQQLRDLIELQGNRDAR